MKTNIQISNGRIDFDYYKPNVIDIFEPQKNTGKEYGFVCYLNSNEEEVCHIGFTKKEDNIELSYSTNENFRNQGYMSEALPKVLAWIFKYTTEEKILAIVTNNPYSEKLLVKNKFSLINSTDSKETKLYALERKKQYE